jgi:type I restriction enzyme S subunit
MHVLNGPKAREDILKQSTGTTRQRISRGNLKGVKVPLPPLIEQRRIAAILDKAEELRAKRRAAIALLDQLPQAIFLEMFGDPATNPLSWPLKRVGDLLLSANYGTSQKARSAGSWPMLRMNNLTANGHLDLREMKFIDLKPDDVPKYTVKRGDVLFNRTNSADLVGKTALYSRDEPAAFAGYLVRLRTSGVADPVFLSSFMNLSYTKRVLRSMAKSIVGMANINAKEVQTIAIPLPPVDLQHRFAARVEAIHLAKAPHQSALAECEALFGSLQSDAFPA